MTAQQKASLPQQKFSVWTAASHSKPNTVNGNHAAIQALKPRLFATGFISGSTTILIISTTTHLLLPSWGRTLKGRRISAQVLIQLKKREIINNNKNDCSHVFKFS